MSSRIEQIIDEIDEYVESCKFQPLSTTKIVVQKEEIMELLRELRLKTPDEIKRYQKIISTGKGRRDHRRRTGKSPGTGNTARDHAEGLCTGERDDQRGK